MFRTCGVAEASSACDSTGNARRTRGCSATCHILARTSRTYSALTCNNDVMKWCTPYWLIVERLTQMPLGATRRPTTASARPSPPMSPTSRAFPGSAAATIRALL